MFWGSLYLQSFSTFYEVILFDLQEAAHNSGWKGANGDFHVDGLILGVCAADWGANEENMETWQVKQHPYYWNYFMLSTFN